MQVLIAIDSRGAAATITEMQKVLDKVKQTADVSTFLDAIGRLPQNLGKEPFKILEEIQRSYPSWILDEASLQDWKKDATNNWLWVLGEAGTGKSCIATYIAWELQGSSSQESSLSDHPAPGVDVVSDLAKVSVSDSAGEYVLPVCGVAMYYCTYTAQMPRGVDHVIRILLHQVITQLWEIAPSRAYKYLADLQKLVNYEGFHQGVLNASEVFQNVAEDFDRLYIVIDALDELAPADLRVLVEKLKKLSSPTVKFFTTSREGSHHLPDAYVINANRNESTIRTFVRERLRSISEGEEFSWPSALSEALTDNSVLEKVAEKVLEVSGANFLCAGLIINQLLDCGEQDDLDYTLDHLSRTVDGLIGQVMARIDRQPRLQAEKGRAALQWVIFMRGSMSYTELQYALAFHFYGDKPLSTIKSHLSEFNRQRLTEATCYFLSIKNDSDPVSVHKAVKDFCVDDEQGKAHFPEAHSKIASVCLTCLAENKLPCETKDEWASLVDSNPFIQYAARNWGWHMAAGNQTLLESLPPNLDLMDLLSDDPFLDVVTAALQPRLAKLGVWQPKMWKILGTKTPPISALHILAFFNLDRLAKQWFKHSRANPEGLEDSLDEQIHSSALYLAAIQGSERMVRVLLEFHANPMRENGSEGATALRGACLNDNEDVVEALFRKTPDERCAQMVFQKDEHGRPTLADACRNVAIMRRMLRVISKMNGPAAKDLLLDRSSSTGHTVMHAAAEADNGDVIDELLSFRPGGRVLRDRPSKDTKDTPLHTAARRGSASAVERLLKQGADPNNLQANGSTPAILACRREAVITSKCLELLLPHTDITVQNKRQKRTVLHMACDFGRPRHVSALLPYLKEKREVLFARDWNDMLAITCATQRPHKHKFLCIEYLIPLMGNEIPPKDAQNLQRVLVRHNQPKPFGLLLEQYPDPMALMVNKSTTLLEKCIRHGHLPIVKTIFEVYGKGDMEVRNPEGQTPLVQAAALGCDDIVRYLLDQGADIRAIADGDQSILQQCVELGNADIANAIWKYDAELLKPDADHNRLLDMASARNPVRKLWQSRNMVPNLNRSSQEVECLHSVKEGLGVVLGSEQSFLEDRETLLGVGEAIYLESDPIKEYAKSKSCFSLVLKNPFLGDFWKPDNIQKW